MAASGIETALRRDRLIVVAALAVMTLLAWAYLAWLAASMQAQDAQDAARMPGMDMAAMNAMLLLRPWTSIDFAVTFAMWAIMMVAMMTPSATPMVLLYAGVGRKARADGRVFSSSAWFVAGYLLVWMAFSLIATGAQWLLAALALLTVMMVTASGILAGALLIAAGIYQWLPLKDLCLRECQAPFGFIARHGGFSSRPLGAIRLGLVHGLYCVGCCWALMLLLFVGGVMNILWIALLSILVLIEKTVGPGRAISRLIGLLLVAAGLGVLLQASGCC